LQAVHALIVAHPPTCHARAYTLTTSSIARGKALSLALLVSQTMPALCVDGHLHAMCLAYVAFDERARYVLQDRLEPARRHGAAHWTRRARGRHARHAVDVARQRALGRRLRQRVRRPSVPDAQRLLVGSRERVVTARHVTHEAAAPSAKSAPSSHNARVKYGSFDSSTYTTMEQVKGAYRNYRQSLDERHTTRFTRLLCATLDALSLGALCGLRYGRITVGSYCTTGLL